MLPIINILLIVGILLFILYNLYVDTRNWSNTGSFLEGMSNPNLTLKSLVNKGATATGLGKCEGDCDNDGDCIGNLKCFQRGSSNDVPPGCKAGGAADIASHDYCFDPNDAWPTWPNEKELVDKGGTPPGSGERLGECEGDCDNDNDCIGDLKCFQRSASHKVPGCKYPSKNTNMSGSHDFCYDPNKRNEPPLDIGDSKKILLSTTGRYGNKSKIVDCAPGTHILSESQAYSTNDDCGPKDACQVELNDKCQARVKMLDRCKSKHDDFSFSMYVNSGNTISKDQCNLTSTVIPSGFKLVSTGQPLNDVTQEQCKTFADRINGYSFSVINESGNPKGCMLQDGTPPGAKGVYYNTGGTADCGVFNGISMCVAKDTAGSASSAMEDQIRNRAGNVASMDSNVPQNCKPGCVAPTGPYGNCKVVQVQGREMRECPYKCVNNDFDSAKCQYNQDCNACGNKMFDPDAPPDMGGQQSIQMVQGQMSQGQMSQGQMSQGQMSQGQMGGQMYQGQIVQGSGQVGNTMNSSSYLGSMELGSMPGSASAATVATAGNALFDENIMKQVLEKKDLIPSDINTNNEETSFNMRIGKKFMLDTATIRNFALPNIDTQDYIELGRIVKSIKMREKDPQEADQVKSLYTKLNSFVLELLTDSSLDMKGYDNSGMPTQLNNKTRTTGMFGENSNSLITNTDTDKVKESVRRQKVKPYNSIWSLYQ